MREKRKRANNAKEKEHKKGTSEKGEKRSLNKNKDSKKQEANSKDNSEPRNVVAVKISNTPTENNLSSQDGKWWVRRSKTIRGAFSYVNYLICILLLAILVTLLPSHNGKLAIIYVATILILYTLWKAVLLFAHESEKKDALNVFMGAGILVFAIFTFFGTSAVFMFGGTETYCPKDIQIDNGAIIIDDLVATNQGNSMGLIEITTHTEPQLPCDHRCTSGVYPKGPKEEQRYNFKLYLNEKVSKFLLIQQVKQSTYGVPLTDITTNVRTCTCTVDSNQVNCDKEELDWFRDYWYRVTG